MGGDGQKSSGWPSYAGRRTPRTILIIVRPVSSHAQQRAVSFGGANNDARAR